MMIRRTLCRSILMVALCGVFLAGSGDAQAQGNLPGGVTSRLKKIDEYLKKVQSRLDAGSVNRNDLERARTALEEIRKSYPDAASHPEVAAASGRIEEVAASVVAFETGKKEKQAEKAQAAAADEKTLTDWAARLSAYKADSRAGSQGLFGIPAEDIETILAENPRYEEAKALYADFLKTGINPDDHPALRQAEYDIRVAILNYESSRNRIPEEAAKNVGEALTWMDARKAEGKVAALPKDRQQQIARLVENSARLFPGSDEVKKLAARKAELDRRLEEADRTILENRKMAEDRYKGTDADSLKQLARSIVSKEPAISSMLKVNIISPDWSTESVVEWTDTTHTALQHRKTESVTAQVAAQKGADIFLYTVHLNKDTVGGNERPLTGHIMFTDRLLEKNIR